MIGSKLFNTYSNLATELKVVRLITTKLREQPSYFKNNKLTLILS